MSRGKGSKFNTSLRRFVCLASLFALLASCLPLPPVQAEAAGASPYAGQLRISEIMAKNHATLTDELGAMPDYIELENLSGRLGRDSVHDWLRLRTDDPEMGVMKEVQESSKKDLKNSNWDIIKSANIREEKKK